VPANISYRGVRPRRRKLPPQLGFIHATASICEWD
jgi:hypothetical protein